MSQRPRQVTVAAWLAVGGCALLVVSLFDSMARLRSVQNQHDIRELLSRGNLFDVTVDQVIAVMHGLVLVSGALAATGVVLAVFTLQRHRGARIGLSVVAGLLMVFSVFVAGLLPLLVVVAAAMLWGRDARAWFDGRAPEPAAGPAAGPPGPPANQPPHQSPHQPPAAAPAAPAAPPAIPPAAPPSGWGPPMPPPVQAPGPGQPPPWASAYGRPGSAPFPVPVPGADPWHGPLTPLVRPRPPRPRPLPLTVAAWLTWVFSALTALAFLLVVIAVLVAHDELLSALQRDPTVADLDLSGRELLSAVWVACALIIFWSLAASALAFLAYRRVRGARWALLASAVVAAVAGFAAVPVGWLHGLAALVCVVLLCVPQRPSERDPR